MKRVFFVIGPVLFLLCLLITTTPDMSEAAIVTTIPRSLPSTTPAMAIVYSSGYVRMKDLFRVGIVCDVIRFIVLILIGYPIANFFLTLKIAG